MKPIHCLGLLPFVAFFSGGWLAEHLAPRVFGLPFLMAWNVLWLVASSGIMALMFCLDGSTRAGAIAEDTVDGGRA
ncbi:hypothetical protein PTE30175_01536 [Pandoraea terrae]|uniref:DUF3311 domain-containing protein n=1 Tax=Pandoraea terrae TaxID=1537710 RepID=A0A5E4TXU3_9BURK|nr:DUF3311 domain-containing protein [Pandoraea terrae]VVD90689.1 hypothetical protein PTE30175_01536 [Pandoraea terrae]